MRVTEMLQTRNAFPLELRIGERVLKVRWAERGGGEDGGGQQSSGVEKFLTHLRLIFS